MKGVSNRDICFFIYNILLIILYSVYFNLYLKSLLEKNKQPIFIASLFNGYFFICDNVIVYMTEFINSFATEYNQTFMTAPFFKDHHFFICCNFCLSGYYQYY